MPIYIVKDGHILHDGTLYAPGDTISLKEDQADGLSVEMLQDGQEGTTLTNKEMIALLAQRGVEIPPKPTRAQLLELLAESEKTDKKDGQ
ncbi:MAG: hypothetical protein LBQ00_06815 [Syntrophobacterales bacterium]|jgi:hypothetical protein|nr:hypothetical protein [Syntrophobacterales bacterium]